MPKLGIIQSRGLGDICLALPIANYYRQQGHDVVWPICEEFLPSVQTWVPWVQWVPMVTDSRGLFFYQEPQKILTDLACDQIICLYQSLSTHPEFSQEPWFQIQKFDEYKYTRAGVPFRLKWTLSLCLEYQAQSVQSLRDDLKLVAGQPYYVTHTQGSDWSTEPDLSNIPPEWRRIQVEDYPNHSIFAWREIIDQSQALIAIDSVIANMMDQLGSLTDLYWIPRSHIHLTPVLGQTWCILEPPQNSRAAQRIFASG